MKNQNPEEVELETNLIRSKKGSDNIFLVLREVERFSGLVQNRICHY